MSEGLPPGSMSGVLRALARRPRTGRGRVLLVMSAQRGEGASTIARAVSEAGALGTTLLIDLDVMRDTQMAHYRESGLGLTMEIDGRLKGQSFYRVIGADGRPDPHPRPGFTYRRVGRSKLFVSSFDPRALRPDERVQVLNGPSYWAAVRQSCDLCVIDAPALVRSRIGLAAAAHADGVVLVVSGRSGKASATSELKSELEAVGAPVLGAVYTEADPFVLNVERRLFG